MSDIAPITPSDSGTAATGEPREATRAQLAALAAEFESMLLMSVLRDMRTSGQWAADESGLDTLGAETFDQTFDVELSRFLSQAGGLGLSQQLLSAFDAMVPGGTDGQEAAGLPAAPPIVAPPAAQQALRAQAAYVTSGFGWRQDPITQAPSFHKGVDIRASEGDQIPSIGPGRVIFSGVDGGYGTSVVLEHANGMRTRYAHLSATLVTAGDQVEAGQAIGLAGQTGRATGPHLHYEVLTPDGRPVDPLARR